MEGRGMGESTLNVYERFALMLSRASEWVGYVWLRSGNGRIRMHLGHIVILF